jgi:hypothetical protein
VVLAGPHEVCPAAAWREALQESEKHQHRQQAMVNSEQTQPVIEEASNELQRSCDALQAHPVRLILQRDTGWSSADS